MFVASTAALDYHPPDLARACPFLFAGRFRTRRVSDRELHPDDVREGLLTGRAAALETMRGWVEGLLYGGGWRLSDPEAAVQDVVVKLLALAREGRIQAGTDFKSFVMKVARHAYTDLYRREKLRGPLEGGADADTLAGAGDPEHHLALDDERRLLVYIVQGIGDDCRQLWRWIYGEELSHDEVADRLDITRGNLRVRVHRCLKRARALAARHVPPERPPEDGDG